MTSVVWGGLGLGVRACFGVGGGRNSVGGRGVQVLYACLRTWLLDMSLRISSLRDCTLQEMPVLSLTKDSYCAVLGLRELWIYSVDVSILDKVSCLSISRLLHVGHSILRGLV